MNYVQNSRPGCKYASSFWTLTVACDVAEVSTRSFQCMVPRPPSEGHSPRARTTLNTRQSTPVVTMAIAPSRSPSEVSQGLDACALSNIIVIISIIKIDIILIPIVVINKGDEGSDFRPLFLLVNRGNQLSLLSLLLISFYYYY